VRLGLFLFTIAAILGAAEPAAVLLGGNPEQWGRAAQSRGWRLVVPPAMPAPLWTEAGAQALQAYLRDPAKSGLTDSNGAFLIALGDSATAAFYLASRMPDLWRAVLAISGNPKTAIETNRLYAANTQLAPVLWTVPTAARADMESLYRKLTIAGYNVELRSGEGFTVGQALDWLASKRRDPVPYKVDCETGSPAFPRCYWAEIVKFDASRRNDAIPSTRVAPGSGAALGLGGFGFDPAAPGPGLLVGFLQPDYKGKLKLEDRIVSVGGRAVRDARDYLELMDQMKEEKTVAVIVQRGKERVRIETRIVMPQREELLTARLQAEFVLDGRVLQVVTRNIAAVRLRVPEAWVPATVNWNGTEAGPVPNAGCWILSDENGPRLSPCQ
jgi:hypothetical protein